MEITSVNVYEWAIASNHPSWANWRSQPHRPRMFLCPEFL